MKYILVLLAVSLSSGCSLVEYKFPWGTGDYVAHSGCLTFKSDFPLDQDALDHNVQLAQSMLDQMGVVRSEDFCSEFEKVPFVVSKGDTVLNTETYGEYSFFRGILLTHKTQALLHEMLHEVDLTRDKVVCTEVHCWWVEKGYFDADHAFIGQVTDPKDG